MKNPHDAELPDWLVRIRDEMRARGFRFAGDPLLDRQSNWKRYSDEELCRLYPKRSDYDSDDDFAKSLDEAYRVIRERRAAGGKGWEPK